MNQHHGTTADQITVGIAQIAPVWLDRTQTQAKIVDFIAEAGSLGCRLVAFGEALLPGYPFWIEHTDGARFESDVQKEIFAHYAHQGVDIEAGDLEPVCRAAREQQVAVMLGCVERPSDRGGHSLYCTLAYIDASGTIQSVHRKLVPTYEERLCWGNGDGHGLRTHPLSPFRVGGLNCWENWVPLARAALYAQGEDLHVAVWPGNLRNTVDITRFVARESRSYVISAAGLLRSADIGTQLPHADALIAAAPKTLADGGSCIAGPDGEWVVEPVVGEERLIVATLDHSRVRAARHNFDPAGHYARPDVLQLSLNRARQGTLRIPGDKSDPQRH